MKPSGLKTVKGGPRRGESAVLAFTSETVERERVGGLGDNGCLYEGETKGGSLAKPKGIERRAGSLSAKKRGLPEWRPFFIV